MTSQALLSVDADKVSVKDLLTMLGNMTNQSQPNSQPIPESKPILTHLIPQVQEEWIENLKDNDDNSKSTRPKYEQHLRFFGDWYGSKPVSEVKASDITAYRNYLSEDKELKHSSINAILVALRQFFKYCVEQGSCEKSPRRRLRQSVKLN